MSEFPRSIGTPATRALARIDITTLEQLTKLSEAELLQIHGVGPKAVRLLKEEMAKQGMEFAE